MLNLAKLPTPTAKGLLDFKNEPGALKAAQISIQRLIDLANTITPISIAAIAQQLYPSEPLGVAVTKLDEKIQQACAGIASHAAQSKDVLETERTRLAPVMGTAARRVFAIHEHLAQIESAIARAKQDNESRRAKMLEAKMSADEIEKLAPAVFDASGLLAERELLNDELNILNAFITTGDESCLPDGFEAVVVPKITIPLSTNVADLIGKPKAA